jgi:hypothetical protein
MKRWTNLLVLALVVCLAGGVAEAAKGAKGAKPDKGNKAGKQDGVAGTVTKVEEKTITIRTRGKKGAEVVVTTDDKTQFTGVAALGDIKVGMQVRVSPASGTAQKISVVGEGGKGKGKKAKKQ